MERECKSCSRDTKDSIFQPDVIVSQRSILTDAPHMSTKVQELCEKKFISEIELG